MLVSRPRNAGGWLCRCALPLKSHFSHEILYESPLASTLGTYERHVQAVPRCSFHSHAILSLIKSGASSVPCRVCHRSHPRRFQDKKSGTPSIMLAVNGYDNLRAAVLLVTHTPADGLRHSGLLLHKV